MNRILTLLLTGLLAVSVHAELFISEYIEGSSNNKSIEIYNPGPSTVNLSTYSLRLYSNGSATPSQSLNLSGTLGAGHVFVVSHALANASILAVTNITSSAVINFNGDDAVALVNGTTLIDVFGQIGFDPGTQWGTGNTTTLNYTLRRKSGIAAGDPNGSDTFDPSIEWDSYAQDNSDDLGSHGSTPPNPLDTTHAPFTIFHINDMHSRLTPHDLKLPSMWDTTGFEVVGGASRLATKMLQLKAADTNSLVLDAGDISEGNPLGDLRGNGGMIDFMNLLDRKLKTLGGHRGIDASVVGNHDVRYRSYLQNMKNASFPFISMNVCNAGTQNPYFKAYTIVNFGDVRVGILGFTNSSDQPGAETDSIIDVLQCAWTDSDPSTINVKDYVDSLRINYGCNAVVLLAHYGHTAIVAPTTTIDIPLIVDGTSTKIPEVIVSGHWHSMTDLVWQPKTLNNRSFIAEAASYMEFIGEVNVDSLTRFVSAEKHAIRASEIIPDLSVDSLLNVLITEYNDSFPGQPLFDTIGYSSIDLTLDDDKWWSMNEYPWPGDNSAGNFICEAMKWKLIQSGKTCDLAMQAGGGIRRDIKAGPLTYLSLYEMYPWDDDMMTRVSMSGAQIWKFIEDKGCNAALSEHWQVWADDGEIDSIKYNGNHVTEYSSTLYNVAISRYMFDHPDGASLGTLVEHTASSIREGAVDYGATFPISNPYNGFGRRYVLNTDQAGIFDAVVTMVGDNEDSPIYENAFIRLLHASASTVAQIGKYVSSQLVNPDGSINNNHQMAESMHYRGYLGFPRGLLKNGTILRIKAEGGFYRFSPQWVEEEGIAARDSVFELLGYDTTLSRPVYMSAIDSFWNEQNENHYVSFHARRVSSNSVADRYGKIISTYQVGGYNLYTLPGSNGDILEIRGTQTQYWASRRFRVDNVSVLTTGFPPVSQVEPISPSVQTSSPITLYATVNDGAAEVYSFTASADAQIVQGAPTVNYGTSTNMYLQRSGGTYGEERAWVKFAATGIPSGKVIQRATVTLYPWAHSGSGFDAALHFSANDSWTESGITWNSAPSFDSITGLDTVALSAEDVWYDWDVTSLVRSQLLSGDSTLSFVLRALNGSGSYTFDAKEYNSGSMAPRLEIIFADAGADTTVTQVEFFYRYSANGSSYGTWTSAGVDNTAPFGSLPFNYPQGHGYYEFYSIAHDNDGNTERAPVSADAHVQYDRFYNAPVLSNPFPSNGSYNVPLNTHLSVTVTDTDFDIMTIRFYVVNGSTETLIGTVANVASGNTASIPATGFSLSHEYKWCVRVSDGFQETRSPNFTFNSGAAPVQAPAGSTMLLVLLGFIFAVFGGIVIMRKRFRG